MSYINITQKFLLIISISLSLISNSTASNLPFTVDAVAKAGNNRHYAQINAFVPITFYNNQSIFSDFRFMHHLPHNKTGTNSLYKSNTYEANVGLGYRWSLKDDLVIGNTVYADIRRANINQPLPSERW